MLTTLYFFVVSFAAIALMSLTVFAWTRRHTLLGRAFFLVMLSSTGTSILNYGILISPDLPMTYFLARLQTLFDGLTWIQLLMFSLVYTGRVQRLHWQSLALLYTSVLAIFVVNFTDPLHGAYYQVFELRRVAGYSLIVMRFNWFYYAQVLFFAVFYVLAAFHIAMSSRLQHGLLRQQQRSVLVAVSLPMGIVLVMMIIRLTWPTMAIVYQPYTIGFAGMAILLARALLVRQLLQLSPIAHPLVLREVPQPVIITDTAGQMLDLNPAAQTLLNCTPDGMVGQSIAVVLPELARATDGMMLSLGLLGDAHTYECTVRPLTAANTEVGTLYILRDVTTQQQIQQQALEIALERERRQLLTRFIEGALHEFRTPLTNINTSAYLLEHRDQFPPEKAAQYLDRIKANVVRLSDLTTMMGLLASLQTRTPTIAPVDLRELVQQVVFRWKGKGASIDVMFTDGPCCVHGSEALLARALDALIDNAHRYGPPDGTIRLRIALVDEQIIISVQDEGPGIAPDIQPHIFKTFWRWDSAHTTPGLGLGLPLALQIAQLHAGDLTVESTVGQGSRFDLALPLIHPRQVMLAEA